MGGERVARVNCEGSGRRKADGPEGRELDVVAVEGAVRVDWEGREVERLVLAGKCGVAGTAGGGVWSEAE